MVWMGPLPNFSHRLSPGPGSGPSKPEISVKEWLELEKIDATVYQNRVEEHPEGAHRDVTVAATKTEVHLKNGFVVSLVYGSEFKRRFEMGCDCGYDRLDGPYFSVQVCWQGKVFESRRSEDRNEIRRKFLETIKDFADLSPIKQVHPRGP